MPVYTLDPVARLSTYSSFTKTGGTSGADALSDDSDATYVRSNTPRRRTVWSVDDPSSPEGEFVSACPGVRTKKDGTMRAVASVCAYASADSGIVSTGTELRVPHGASAADHELDAKQGCHDLGSYWYEPARAPLHGTARRIPFGVDDVALGLMDTSSSANRAYFYEAWIKAYYLLAATAATPSAPVDPVEDTQYPVCTTEISCVVEDWQVPSGEDLWLCDGDVEFRVYDAADCDESPTTPPAGATPVWSTFIRFTEAAYIDGTTPSTQNVSATPNVPLENGEYVLFVRASRDLPAGARRYWSDWAVLEFTVDIDLPTTPALTASADDTNQRVDLSLVVSTTAGYDGDAMTATIERSDDGGVTWTPVRGCSGVAVAAGANTMSADYEAPRGASVTYRARIADTLTSGGTTFYSGWDEDAVTSYVVSGWNLKVPEDPSLNWLLAPVLAAPSAERDREVAVFHPLGRQTAIAIAADSEGETGTLELFANGVAAVAKLQALVAWAGALRIETPFGEERYIAATGAGWTIEGTASVPRRQASLEYVEVGQPEVTQ